MRLRRFLLFLGIVVLGGMLILIVYIYPFYSFFFTVNSSSLDARLEVLSGAGNTGFLVTDSAIVVIDTKMGKMGRDLAERARKEGTGKKIIVINTHFHGDHVYGNRNFEDCIIYTAGYERAFATKNYKSADMPDIFIQDSLILPLGDETIELRNLGRGHTFADLVVYLQKRKLLFAGDLIFNKIHPALIKEDGSSLEGWKSILDRIPQLWEVNKVVPGHGDPGGAELIGAMKQYFVDMQQAAHFPDSSAGVHEKYHDWMKMPLMASPGMTIKFIRESGLE